MVCWSRSLQIRRRSKGDLHRKSSCRSKIGDGSSREQAASSQKVLGGWADLAEEYSTKRYRSNLINWGILPLITKEPLVVKNGDVVLIQDIETVLKDGREELTAYLLDEKQVRQKRDTVFLRTAYS